MSNNNEYNEAIKKAHYKLNKQAIGNCVFCNGCESFCKRHKPCKKCIVGSGKLHNHSGRHKRKRLQLCSRCYLPETEFNKRLNSYFFE